MCVRDRPVDEVARLARFAEGCGYGHLFLPDLRGGGSWVTSGRDAFVSLGAAFEATTELRAGIGVAAVVFHQPASLARLAGTLNEQSGGRFTLGIGVSHREAAGDVYPRSPLAEMRRWAGAMGGDADGGELSFGAGFPVLIGALAEDGRLGASAADGVVLNWLTPEHARTRWPRSGPRPPTRRGTGDSCSLRADVAADAAHADAVSYDTIDNYHRHFVAQGLTDPEAIVAGTCLSADDLAAARDRLAAYADAGIDVLCVYPTASTRSRGPGHWRRSPRRDLVEAAAGAVAAPPNVSGAAPPYPIHPRLAGARTVVRLSCAQPTSAACSSRYVPIAASSSTGSG